MRMYYYYCCLTYGSLVRYVLQANKQQKKTVGDVEQCWLGNYVAPLYVQKPRKCTKRICNASVDLIDMNMRMNSQRDYLGYSLVFIVNRMERRRYDIRLSADIIYFFFWTNPSRRLSPPLGQIFACRRIWAATFELLPIYILNVWNFQICNFQ